MTIASLALLSCGDETSASRFGPVPESGDGERFTLTERPRPDDGSHRSEAVGFTSPCPEPDGGWRPVDATTATQQALGAALERAAQSDDFAGAWVDQPSPDDVSRRPRKGRRTTLPPSCSTFASPTT